MPITPVIILTVNLTVYFLYATVSPILVYLVSTIFFDFQMGIALKDLRKNNQIIKMPEVWSEMT